MKLPLLWKLWLMALLAVNMAGPLALLELTEARVTLAAFMVGAMMMAVLTGRFGFSRILGLGHLPWVPLLIYLVPRLDDLATGTFPGTWLRALIVLNLISLVIDTVDVVRWLGGDREETVSL